MKREPLITVASITAVVTAVLAVIVAAGITVSEQLQTAIVGLVAVLAPFVVALVGRRKVTPVQTQPDERGATGIVFVLLVVALVLIVLALFGAI